MSETVTMTLVALLPKKATEERPIGLTSYAYRAWCRARYHLHEDWARQYKQHSPWDRAIKGMSSLEVAVTRVIKGEVLRQSGKTGITLLLDLKGFYENVDHAALVAAAFRHNYPPLLLHGAMQIYRGKRHLCAENIAERSSGRNDRNSGWMPTSARTFETHNARGGGTTLEGTTQVPR